MSPAGVPQGVFRVQSDSFQWLGSMQCGAGAPRSQGGVLVRPFRARFLEAMYS